MLIVILYFVFILLLGYSLFLGCSDDKKNNNNNPTGPDTVESANWPSDLPDFTYGELTKYQYHENGDFAGGLWLDIADPKSAYVDFMKALSEKDWILNAVNSNDLVWGASYIKHDAFIVFSIDKNGTVARLWYVAGGTF